MPKERRFYKVRWLVRGFLFVLLLTGTAYGETRPIVHYQQAHLVGYRNGSVLVRVVLEVSNPGKREIPVSYGRLDLRLDHRPVGSGTLPQVSFPAGAKKTVTVPVRLSLAALGDVAVDMVGQSRVPWSGEGVVDVRGHQIPLLEEGEISGKTLEGFLGHIF